MMPLGDSRMESAFTSRWEIPKRAHSDEGKTSLCGSNFKEENLLYVDSVSMVHPQLVSY